MPIKAYISFAWTVVLCHSFIKFEWFINNMGERSTPIIYNLRIIQPIRVSQMNNYKGKITAHQNYAEPNS